MSNIRISGGMTSVLNMTIDSHCVHSINKKMNELHSQAPSLMKGMPVLVKLTLKEHEKPDYFISHVCDIIRESGANPFMFEADDFFKTYVENQKLSFIPLKNNAQKTTQKSDKNNFSKSLIIKDTIRSGQQLYAKNRDLIIFGNVNRGSEIISDGSIFVHGSLKGKAMAGMDGDTESVIFTQNLDAELLSVNGIYSINEDFIQKVEANKHTYISLDNEQLTFKTI